MQRVAPFDEPVAKYEIVVASPTLWSVDKPILYQVRTVVRRGDKVLDGVATRCGFRTIRFDADKGFFLNDRPLKLKGTCNHQDFAGVGTAVPDSLWEFRLRKLKEMGSNAYRCSHNPPAAEFLDACDRLGMLVMDENRNFNTTRSTSASWSGSSAATAIIPASSSGRSSMKSRCKAVRRATKWSAGWPPWSRSSTPRGRSRRRKAARCGARLNASKAADVAGFNYQPGEYDAYHKANPKQADHQFGRYLGGDDPRRIHDGSQARSPRLLRHAGPALGPDPS